MGGFFKKVYSWSSLVCHWALSHLRHQSIILYLTEYLPLDKQFDSSNRSSYSQSWQLHDSLYGECIWQHEHVIHWQS